MSFKIVLTLVVCFLLGVKAQEEVNCDFEGSHPENCDTSAGYLSHLICKGTMLEQGNGHGGNSVKMRKKYKGFRAENEKFEDLLCPQNKMDYLYL